MTLMLNNKMSQLFTMQVSDGTVTEKNGLSEPIVAVKTGNDRQFQSPFKKCKF